MQQRNESTGKSFTQPEADGSFGLAAPRMQKGFTPPKAHESFRPAVPRMRKGFTLFTALVAFLLISLSLLLVNSMVSTEKSNYEVISDVADQQEMQAIADLARADDLQVFNYGIRYSVEGFSKKDDSPQDGKPDNAYVLFPSTASSWGQIQEDFVKDRFGVGSEQNQFAIYTARYMISLLLRSEDARGFRVDLVNPDEALMAKLLTDNFEASNNNDDFFEVINCEQGTFQGCVGTFYITLDLSKETVDDATYEKFPQVKVVNSLTGRILKEPILPRGKFRIYVPVRLFKALAASREIAFANGEGVFDADFINGLSGVDKGTAETLIENAVENVAQGKNFYAGEDGFRLDGFDVVVIPNADTGEIISYEVKLYFKDENEKYRVSSLKDNVYGITLKVFA